MIRLPPRSTRNYTLFPSPAFFRSFPALDTPRRGSCDRLRLESAEHPPPRLTLTRGLRLLIAAADRPWILTHFARISTARRQDLDPLPLGRIRQADLARQPAPIGEVTNLGVAVPIHRIIRRHILRPLARQGADKLALIGEVGAPVMELQPVTVSRQADIRRMALHAGGGGGGRPVDPPAPRFMDGRRIAMIDMGIVFQVDSDRSALVTPDRHHLLRNPHHLPHPPTPP